MDRIENILGELKKVQQNLHRSEGDVEKARALLSDGAVEDCMQLLESIFRRTLSSGAKTLDVHDDLMGAAEEKTCDLDGVSCDQTLPNPVCYFENSHCFICKLGIPPVMKRSEIGAYFLREIGAEITKKMPEALEKQTHIFGKAYVVFLNRQSKTEKGKQPYYDNDNVMIKRLLDSILPFIVYDDAAIFCSNIYTYSPSNNSGVEIHVVEQGHLLNWARAHDDIEFAQEIGQKS